MTTLDKYTLLVGHPCFKRPKTIEQIRSTLGSDLTIRGLLDAGAVKRHKADLFVQPDYPDMEGFDEYR